MSRFTFKEPLATAQRHMSNVSPPRNGIMSNSTASPRSSILAALDAELERLTQVEPTPSAAPARQQTSGTMKMALGLSVSRETGGSRQGEVSVMQKATHTFFTRPSSVTNDRPASSNTPVGSTGNEVQTSIDNTTLAQKMAPSKEYTHNFPLYSYKRLSPTPAMLYVRNESQANELVSKLEGPLGFDLEWRVFFGRRMAERRTAVLQLCDDKTILILQLSEMKCFPNKLKEIVESQDIIKMGVNILGDGRKLHRDYGIAPAGLLELSHLARLVDPTRVTSKRMISLQRIVEMYTGFTLSKGPVRTSNWEARLSEEQLEYAANDAHSGLQVYTELMRIAHDAGMILRPIVPPSNSSSTPMGITFLVDWLASPEGGPQDTTDSQNRLNPVISSKFKPKTQDPSKPASDQVPARPSFRPGTGAVHITTREDLYASKAMRPIGRQPLRAYKLWHEDQLPLPDICSELRSLEHPLAKSTVITYVVQALKADTSLPFSRIRLKEFAKLDSGSWERHGRWIVGLEKTGRGAN